MSIKLDKPEKCKSHGCIGKEYSTIQHKVYGKEGGTFYECTTCGTAHRRSYGVGYLDFIGWGGFDNNKCTFDVVLAGTLNVNEILTEPEVCKEHGPFKVLHVNVNNRANDDAEADLFEYGEVHVLPHQLRAWMLEHLITDSVYLEIIQINGGEWRMFVKYSSLLGGRMLCTLTDESVMVLVDNVLKSQRIERDKR